MDPNPTSVRTRESRDRNAPSTRGGAGAVEAAGPVSPPSRYADFVTASLPGEGAGRTSFDCRGDVTPTGRTPHPPGGVDGRKALENRCVRTAVASVPPRHLRRSPPSDCEHPRALPPEGTRISETDGESMPLAPVTGLDRRGTRRLAATDSGAVRCWTGVGRAGTPSHQFASAFPAEGRVGIRRRRGDGQPETPFEATRAATGTGPVPFLIITFSSSLVVV